MLIGFPPLQFATTDLSAIAHNLDEQEQEERYDDEDRPRGSTNMDDTGKQYGCLPQGDVRLTEDIYAGFFSVQVLENALQVWGLTYV